MTRETKVGLVVSCSFLCLVGVVLGSKLREGGKPPDETQADTEVTVAETTPVKSPVNPGTAPHTEKVIPKMTVPDWGTPDVVPATTTDLHLQPVVQVGATGKPTSETGQLVLPPPPAPTSPILPPPSRGTSQTQGMTTVPPSTTEPQPTLLAPPPLTQGGSHEPRPAFAANENATPGSMAGGAAFLLPRGAGRGNTVEPVAPPVKPSTVETAQGPGMALPPPPVLPGTQNNTDKIGAGATVTGNPVESEMVLPGARAAQDNEKHEAPPVAPPLTLKTENVVPPPVPERFVAPRKTEDVVPPPVVAIPGRLTTEPAIQPQRPSVPIPIEVGTPTPVVPSTQVALGQGRPGRNTDLGGPAPSIGLQSSPTSVPVKNDSVDSWDDLEYDCKPGDSLASIAGDQYKSDKYAQALLWYNRTHPVAGDGVKLEPPDLRGQKIYIPDVRILEKRYPNLIGGLTPLPPTESLRGAPAPAAAPAPVNPSYRVVEAGGDTLYVIAKRTSVHWEEIAKLNPTWDPSRPVPSGAVLLLPANAVVDPQHRAP